MRKLVVACMVVALGWLAVGLSGAEDEKPKYTIKDVMKTAHKAGTLKDKVVNGTATDEEKKLLIAMYEAMATSKPPKGAEASWKEKTAALLVAAKEGDVDKLKAASNCMACHREHKGK